MLRKQLISHEIALKNEQASMKFHHVTEYIDDIKNIVPG